MSYQLIMIIYLFFDRMCMHFQQLFPTFIRYCNGFSLVEIGKRDSLAAVTNQEIKFSYRTPSSLWDSNDILL